MDAERPDVVVVGASAAGLAAAVAAADAGADVLVLEPSPDVGASQGLPSPAFDFLWPMQIDRPPSCTRRRLDGVRVISPGVHELVVDAPLSMLDRPAFDRHLVDEAVSRGAQVRAGIGSLRARPDRTLVADGREVRAPVVVFADEAPTRACRYLRPMRQLGVHHWAAALAFEGPDSDAPRRLHVTLAPHALADRSQLEPLGERAWTHWTFYNGRAEHAEHVARRALASDARRHGWPDDVSKHATFRGVLPDPVHVVPDELCADGVMVAGAAAGQAWLEAGVAAGFMAGSEAADAAQAGRTGRAELSRYARAWQRRFVPGHRLLHALTLGLGRLSDEDVDALLAAWRGHVVQVDHLADVAVRGRRLGGILQLAAHNPAAVPATARALVRMVSGSGRRRGA